MMRSGSAQSKYSRLSGSPLIAHDHFGLTVEITPSLSGSIEADGRLCGRISVTVHLLSPAQRPIQTTGDIGRFWKEGYPGVKAQLCGRYPKHEWR